jgi:hypothetical protein
MADAALPFSMPARHENLIKSLYQTHLMVAFGCCLALPPCMGVMPAV